MPADETAEFHADDAPGVQRVPLPPPRNTVTFIGLILIAPVAIFCTARLAWDPSPWPHALVAWVMAAPLVAAAAHGLTRRLSITGAGLQWRSAMRRPRVFPWDRIELLRHVLLTPANDRARVEVEVRAGTAGRVRFSLWPDDFHTFRRQVLGRCPGVVEVDGETGHVALRGGGATAAVRRRKLAVGAAAELPRQWAYAAASALMLFVSILLVASALIPGRGASDRVAAGVIAAVIFGLAVASLLRSAKIIRRLRAMADRAAADADAPRNS